jgi:tRNA threonylcarbamoyladenosine biosynthesis protein TsaE
VPVSVHMNAGTPDQLREIARRVAGECRAGDVLVLTGELGAGKTTFTQGLAVGLGITDAVTSPTFVISRVHRHPGGGLSLVHVDAYRVGSIGELDDIDLEADLDSSVVAIEWGRGLADDLSPCGLDIVISRSDDPDDDERTVTLTARDARWERVLLDEGQWSS